jgi:glycosyltransferase involved in cell wall biosynthesis
LHPRTILHTKRTKSFNASRIADYFTPLKKADAIIVHNQVTLHNLEELGIPGDRIKTIVIPVPNIDFGIKSNDIAQKLNKQKGDIIYATVGFISESKGVLDAIKALKFLPENYKLAIIGGIHPTATNADYLNALTDVILQLNLQNRVFITGYVKKMDELNALIRECDICVYPFDVKYYAYVSSASLTSAIGNYKPIVAYPTPSFIEVNQELPVINLTSSPSYYELARSIAAIDRIKSANLSEKYAKKHAWDKAAISFETVYTDLIASEL